MARTTSSLVIALLGNSATHPKGLGNYDGVSDVTQWIDSATAIVDRVATCATGKGITLSTTELELIERWLAAHYYTKYDPLYASKSTGRASASFIQDPKVPERYKAGALDLDPSGCLAGILAGARAGAAWLGKRPSDQTDYADRS